MAADVVNSTCSKYYHVQNNSDFLTNVYDYTSRLLNIKHAITGTCIHTHKPTYVCVLYTNFLLILTEKYSKK